MINKEKLNDVLVEYKKVFKEKTWEKEKYKWEAIKAFQDNWDINAENFPQMLSDSFSLTDNLLSSNNHFPRLMITELAEQAPEEVRSMFASLFDENRDTFERIDSFKNKATELLEKHREPGLSHYQTENSISTYLWLHYPDKYYIYKFSEVKKVSEMLGSNYKVKKGAYKENITNSFLLYNEICDELKKDDELVGLLESQLTDDCYPDSQLKTLTIDVGYFISRHYQKEVSEEEEWVPKDYSPNISTEKWIELLNDSEVSYESSLEIMKRFKDIGGEATCTELANKYGETANFYINGSVSLAKRVLTKTGTPPEGERHYKFWPVLYVGKNADQESEGVFVWKLRDELSAALDEIDLSDVNLYSKSLSEDKTQPSYSFEQLQKDVGINKETLNQWLEAIEEKRQAIFFGPPGTGKTYIAKHLAKYLVQGGRGQTDIVQFHPTYAYEDFIQGIRPSIENGDLVFDLQSGRLLNFCNKAKESDDCSVLIIDEINRANLSKVFGELMYLLEYREEEVVLASGYEFSIPNNVLIIGTMNTADRSIALVDFALRRRFAFIELAPNYDLLKRFLSSNNSDGINIIGLVELVKKINSKIEDKNYFLGTSFFLKQELGKSIKRIWQMEIEPYLEEYFFANPEVVDEVRWAKIKNEILF